MESSIKLIVMAILTAIECRCAISRGLYITTEDVALTDLTWAFNEDAFGSDRNHGTFIDLIARDKNINLLLVVSNYYNAQIHVNAKSS